MTQGRLDHVDYSTLDRAKARFIEAGRSTAEFAARFGFIPGNRFGASANIFQLDLRPFLEAGADRLAVTLVPEGLGTADDARPDDLDSGELIRFWRNIGIKTISVLTNDAASSGMQTILLGLYLPSAAPERVFTEEFMQGFLGGIVEGCRTVGCVYFSGETPQLKTKIVADKLDIAGALFGLLPPGVQPIDSARLGPGNSIVFVASTGPHENGFTSLRDLASRLPKGYRTDIGDGRQYWEAINTPSALYSPLVREVLAAGIRPTNMENITGHGWLKVMRPNARLRYRITDPLPLPRLFEFIREQSRMELAELLQIFNCGAGFAIFTETRAEAEQVVKLAAAVKLEAKVAGTVESAPEREVVVEPWGVRLGGESFALKK